MPLKGYARDESKGFNYYCIFFISTHFWLTVFIVPVKIKLMTPKLVLVKISNRRLFLKVGVVGAF